MTSVLSRTNGHEHGEQPSAGALPDVEALYREDRAKLLRIAGRNAPNPDAGEDAVHDAFVRLLDDPSRVGNPQAFVVGHTKGWARAATRDRGQQRPAGDAIARLADAPTLNDDEGAGPAPCMGDPAVVAKVDAALATLPPADGLAVRLHLLDGLKVSEVAKRLDVAPRTIYTMLSRSLESLRKLGIVLDDEDAEPEQSRGGRVVTPMPTLVATLDREFPRQWIGVQAAEEALRRIHGSCSTTRAVEAQKTHNVPLTKPDRARRAPAKKGAKRRTATPVRGTAKLTDAELIEQARALAATRGGAISQTAVQVAFRIGAPRARRIAAAISGAAGTSEAPAAPEPERTALRTWAPPTQTQVVRTVAEVWLLGARPPISCMFVNSDETTDRVDLAAVSMLGAQREVTGRLIGEGYHPDGPWVDVDPAGPEAMRKFQREGTR